MIPTKTVWLILKHERHQNISDHHEPIGIVIGSAEDANAAIEQLDKEDPDVIETWGGRKYYGHHKLELDILK
jgi:hypothetical protein